MNTLELMVSRPTRHPHTEHCLVRTYARGDADAVHRLAHEGLLPDYVEFDFRDLHRIEAVYLSRGRGHFWVAERNGRVIGMLGLAELEENVAQLRWLRASPDLRDRVGVARRLGRAAAEHAQDRGFLKLALHLPRPVEPDAIAFFNLLGFCFSRARPIGGRNILEFYFNLYERPLLQEGEEALSP